jgi:hypothetical protein
MKMRSQLFALAGLTPKEEAAVTVIQMLYDSSVCTLNSGLCSIETDRLVLFREIMAVCCGSFRKQVSADVVAIRGLMLKCWALKFTNHCASES